MVKKRLKRWTSTFDAAFRNFGLEESRSDDPPAASNVSWVPSAEPP